VKRIERDFWPLGAALLLLATAATFGFWGARLLPDPEVAETLLDEREGWLAAPVPPVRSGGIGLPAGRLGPALGRSPFVSAREAGSAGAGELLADPHAGSERVAAILGVGDQRLAIVGGRTVRPGDALGPARVVAIEAQGLWVTEAGERRWLPVAEAGGVTRMEVY